MKRILAGAMLALLAVTGVAAEGDAESREITPEEARAVVARFIQSVESYQAKFQQQLQSASGEVLEAESGDFWLQRPGRFRWHYIDPWEREIIADQGTIWLYDAELDQVTVRPVGEALLNTPAALLAGDLAALDAYAISGLAQSSGGFDIHLVPLGARGDFKSIGLGFSAAGGLIQLVLQDRFEQRTVITFSEGELNPELPASVFEFMMPAGADVIDQRVTPQS